MQWSEFQDTAGRLAHGATEGDWRSAISRGYYAVFHFFHETMLLWVTERPMSRFCRWRRSAKPPYVAGVREAIFFRKQLDCRAPGRKVSVN